MLILVEARVLNGIVPETLAANLRYMARAGDRIEGELTKRDVL